MIDTHTHLDRIAARQLPKALKRAKAAGVAAIVTVGMDPASSSAAVALARRFRSVYAAVGIHPWQAARHSSEKAVAAIRELATRRRVIAIGETGLDYEDNLFTGESYRGEAAREVQRHVFRRQLELARDLNLPVIVHSRGGAHADIAALLSEIGVSGQAVIQFLFGTQNDVATYARLGCYFSVGGPATDPGQPRLRETVRAIPLNNLVLETDTPYVPPAWKPRSSSEPADLPAIGAYLSALVGLPIDELIPMTTANARRLYRLS